MESCVICFVDGSLFSSRILAPSLDLSKGTNLLRSALPMAIEKFDPFRIIGNEGDVRIVYCFRKDHEVVKPFNNRG
jgi:hypothetical protein